MANHQINSAPRTRLAPRRLRPGDAVGVVAPAGPVDRVRLERALPRIESRGLRIKTYGDLFAQYGYLAGDDDRRAAELNAALADPETTAVFPARGGYGLARIVARLDYSAVANLPKLVAGFSDLTALHAALRSRAGLATLHSPNLIDGWGGEAPPTDWVEDWFWQCTGLTGELTPSPQQPCELRLPPEVAADLFVLAGGVAEGPLVGGNVAVLTALAGTPFMPSLDGAILLLEDVDEQPYRVDRMLAQLKLSGALDALAGVLLGQFTDCDPAPEKPSLTFGEMCADYLTPLGVPVLSGFPTGHVPDNVTLPLGTRVRLDADRRAVSLLEPPFAR